MALKGM